MRGLMMDMPLMISDLLRHAARHHGSGEVVSKTVEQGAVHRYTYRDAHERARKLANALKRLGVAMHDRVATLAWNGYRHFEIYYAAAGSGAVIHTINPRLFADQIVYIANHAEDKLVFFDVTFAPLVEKLAPQLKSVKHFVAMTSEAHLPRGNIPNLVAYEELVEREAGDFDWPSFDERTAACLCYTSGTTGNPKGALYSHRSTILHAYAAALPDALNLSARDVVLPVVPMFHVNAWGLPYSACMVGARLVLPGPGLDGASLHELFESEGVTLSAGVPTVWQGLLAHVQAKGLAFSTMRRTIIGGSACPPAMMEAFETRYGVQVIHAWGMTELSPVGTVCVPKAAQTQWPADALRQLQARQGRAVFGIDMKIVDADGAELPWDGEAAGELMVRGPWVVSEYLKGGASPLVHQ